MARPPKRPARGSVGALIRWEGVKELNENMSRYEKTVFWAIQQIALVYMAKMETYSKAFAPWYDQTSNARQSLHGYVKVINGKTVRIFLSHGVVYGIHLELKYAGRYAIIMPTIEAHVGEIRHSLKEIFR